MTISLILSKRLDWLEQLAAKYLEERVNKLESDREL